jgi:hypothetical protein
MKHVIFCVISAFTALISAAEAKCVHMPTAWSFGETTTDSVVTDGSACVIRRPYTGRKIHIFAARIVSQPSHGSIKISGRATFTYRPAEGFNGRDQYIYKYIGTNGLTPGAVTIRTDVTVN